MDHTGICSIGNSISPLCHSSCIDHIFIKDSFFYKTANFLINTFLISCTHIGAKISFYSICASIFFQPFHYEKGTDPAGAPSPDVSSGVFFQISTVLPRQLSCVGRSNFGICLQWTDQISNQISVCRNCILSHKYHNI